MRYKIIFCLLATILYCAFDALAFELVLDPGHSPKKGGAMSCSGEQEYKYNDALVDYISKYLESKGIKPLLTRKPSDEKALTARGPMARGKDLFISVHHDSVQPQFMTFVDNKPISQKGSGYSIFVSRKNPHFAKSLEYARKLGNFLYQCNLRPSTHHGEKIKGENRELLDEKLGIYAYDDLVVLKTAPSPALLLEAGVLVNPEDEKLVRLDEYKRIIAGGIEAAITAP